MQVGDPKKTAVLAVVAVGAFWFLYSQLAGASGAPKVLRQANNAAADPNAPASSGQVIAMSVEQLRADPFSHPRLAPKTPGGAQPAATSDPAGGATPTAGAPTYDPGESLPDIFKPNGQIGISKDRPDDWPTPQNPGAGAGDTKVVTEKLIPVTLRAIFKVDARTAYLSVDGQEARAYKAGDVIKGDLVVVMVNDDSVILKTSKRTLTLKVGQQGDL